MLEYHNINGIRIPLVDLPDTKNYPLGEIGRTILKNMEENHSSRYWDLAMEGTLIEKVYQRQEELKEKEHRILEQLENGNPRPNTENTMEIVRYLNSLRLMAREMITEEIYEPI